jgi:hypothetical protein
VTSKLQAHLLPSPLSAVGGHRNLPIRGHERLPGEARVVTECDQVLGVDAPEAAIGCGLAAMRSAPDPTQMEKSVLGPATSPLTGSADVRTTEVLSH